MHNVDITISVTGASVLQAFREVLYYVCVCLFYMLHVHVLLIICNNLCINLLVHVHVSLLFNFFEL